MQIMKSGFVLNRTTKTYNSTLTITNTTIPVQGPLAISITGLPAGVTLANATATDANGNPQISVNVTNGTLAPSAVVNNIILAFNNPNNKAINYSVQIFAYITPSITSDQVTTIIDSAGGDITLPGVATLHIPPNTFSNNAIQISKVSSPILTNLINNLPGYKPYNITQLRIKSSTPLGQPVQLIQSLPTNIATSPNVFKYASYIKVDNDEGDIIDTLELLEANVCGNQDAVCSTLDPSAFSPVPFDPNDPIIEIALVTKLPNSSDKIRELLNVPQYSIKPDASAAIDISSSNTINFQASLSMQNGGTSFAFDARTPLPQMNVSAFDLFVSGYQLLRKATNTAHKGVDLAVITGTPVYSVEGNNTTVLNDGQESAIKCGEHGKTIVLNHGDDFYTYYRHLSEIIAHEPDSAPGGTLIAKSGATATCNKPHLHFEVGLDEPGGLGIVTPIDPRPLLLNDMSQYLLPSDPSDSLPLILNADTILKNIDSANKGLTLYLKLRVNGKDQSTLNTLSATDLIQLPINWRKSAIGVNQYGFSGANLEPLPSGPNGSMLSIISSVAQIDYNSGPISLGTAIEKAAQGVGSVTDMITKNKVTVNLEMCSFRLNYCHSLVEWQIKASVVTVDATKGSTGKGTVTSTPEGITCKTGSDQNCSSSFSNSGSVTLTAKPDSGYIVSSWSGDCASQSIAPDGNSGTCTITMDGKPKNVNVFFNPLAAGTYHLILFHSGSGSVCKDYYFQAGTYPDCLKQEDQYQCTEYITGYFGFVVDTYSKLISLGCNPDKIRLYGQYPIYDATSSLILYNDGTFDIEMYGGGQLVQRTPEPSKTHWETYGSSISLKFANGFTSGAYLQTNNGKLQIVYDSYYRPFIFQKDQ
ncbi:peptidoglycan DD-metalloendopeptidase family protein [Methylomonas koyamae]|uniref:peptidoglycan DD-metalloendopeptidase family protein n=1 Tax=Methylomonas koyamae TaxID=702114 RepID=UPI0016424F72|nr:peptidoglycan DD-metalloendopeptidase family protein [Methylomonas koyamae]